MSSAPLATLTRKDNNEVFTFPCGVLNYNPYIPRKRTLTKQTAKGSFTQVSTPLFLNGTEVIEWDIPATVQSIAFQLLDLYNLNINFVFKGVWGEEYLVEFIEYKMESNSGFFSLIGKFRIICVDKAPKANCG